MCDMPIPFGAEFDASAPGTFEQSSSPPSSSSSRAKENLPKLSQVEPIRSAYVPRYTQSSIHHAPPYVYQPPRKSPQAAERVQSFSYYPSSFGAPSLPQQGYYYPASNPHSMHHMYRLDPSPRNYHQHQRQQFPPSYQYQPVQLKPAAEQYSVFQSPEMTFDPRSTNVPYEMGRNSHGTYEKCGSFCSPSDGYSSNLMTNSEPERYADYGARSDIIPAPSRPYRFY